MKLTTEQVREMLEAARPLMKWMSENCHPHCEVTVDACTVEIKESLALTGTNAFVKD